MLEIVVIHRLCRAIGALSKSKGLPVVWFQAILIAAFFGGEVYGCVATAVMSAIAVEPGQSQPPPLGLMYLGAIFSGGAAAALIFGVAWVWPTAQQPMAVAQCQHCGESLTTTSHGCPMCGQEALTEIETSHRLAA